MAEALTCGHVDDAEITVADDAMRRAGRLAVTHGMQKPTARIALTGVLLDALREDPAGALELTGVFASAGPLRDASQGAATLVAGARTSARYAVATSPGVLAYSDGPLGDAPATVSAGDDGPKLLSAGSTTPAGSSTISS